MITQRDIFLRAQRRFLLHHLFMPWQRRGFSLLQVGLKSGLHPDFFWEAGFDVSALDPDPHLLESVRAEASPKVDFHISQPDHQYFNDETFDYAVVAHCGLQSPDILKECLRVARYGIIILEWNRFSLAELSLGADIPKVWPWSLAWLLKKECPNYTTHFLTNLILPAFTWPPDEPVPIITEETGRGLSRRIHNMLTPLPIGALMGVRVDKDPTVITPIGAVTEAVRAAAKPNREIVAAPRVSVCKRKRD